MLREAADALTAERPTMSLAAATHRNGTAKATIVAWSRAGFRRTFLLVAFLVLVAGCYGLRTSRGGGQTAFSPPRAVDPGAVALPAGYAIDTVATGLTFPTGVAVDDEGTVFVVESGYAYGARPGVARLLRLGPGTRRAVVAHSENPPWNGVTFHDGHFYVAGGHVREGEILRISTSGSVEQVVGGLPSLGDHHTNGPVVGPDGVIYFGQGTATNSGVVGVDNYDYGWLARRPSVHDVPCDDVTLTGQNFVSIDPLSQTVRDRTETGAFTPFGTSTTEGQRVAGQTPCSGAIFRIKPGGGLLELVAWGLRNPFGLAFDEKGRLFATDNGYDDRGSRPVWGTGDFLYLVQHGMWYGWPDYAGGVPISAFKPPGREQPDFLLARHPNEAPRPAALLDVHGSSNGIDFSRNDSFGYRGDAFVAQFGDLAPEVGKVVHPVGFRVVRIVVDTGIVHGFAENFRGVGPASRVGGAGLERPIAVRFSPDGSTLFVVDFGVMLVDEEGSHPQPETGVLWRITRSAE